MYDVASHYAASRGYMLRHEFPDISISSENFRSLQFAPEIEISGIRSRFCVRALFSVDDSSFRRYWNLILSDLSYSDTLFWNRFNHIILWRIHPLVWRNINHCLRSSYSTMRRRQLLGCIATQCLRIRSRSCCPTSWLVNAANMTYMFHYWHILQWHVYRW